MIKILETHVLATLLPGCLIKNKRSLAYLVSPNNFRFFRFLACLYKVNECLCDTHGVRPHAHALAAACALAQAHDQNVLFLC